MVNQHSDRQRIPHVVICGAGFGGLAAARALRPARVRVTVIDRANHHLFQPLLYQVATAGLAAGEVAQPIRHVLRAQENATVVMAQVVGVDTARHCVKVDGGGEIPYDELVLALGARHSYFGNDAWEAHAPGLKTLDDATRIRNSVLLCFERAEREPDERRRAALMTVAVVGGGPTGVEMAGALAELLRDSFRREFRHIQPRRARIVLLEAGPALLPPFGGQSQAYALQSLRRLGVEVRLEARVEHIERGLVRTSHGTLLAGTVVWAAGVQAQAVGEWLGVETDKTGRIPVTPALSLPELSNVHVLGDLAKVEDGRGGALPGLAQVAQQQGSYVGRKLARRAARQGAPAGEDEPFVWRNRGNLATIGRNQAIAEWGSDGTRFALRGSFAAALWSMVHIAMLSGSDNRLLALMRLGWNWITRRRSVRILTGCGIPDDPFAPDAFDHIANDDADIPDEMPAPDGMPAEAPDEMPQERRRV